MEAKSLLDTVRQESRPGIQSDWQADRIVQKMQRMTEEACAQIQHHQQQIAGIEEETQRRTAYCQALLNAYLDKVPVKVAGTQISYKLQSGKLVRKLAHLEAKIADEQAVIRFLEESGAEALVKIKKAANWAELKKQTRIEGNALVDAQTAEVIPGVEVVLKPETFRVEKSHG